MDLDEQVIGVDYNYHQVDKRNYKCKLHIFYSTNKSFKKVPHMDESILAYKKALEVCKKNIVIKNETRGGKLEVFEKIIGGDVEMSLNKYFIDTITSVYRNAI